MMHQRSMREGLQHEEYSHELRFSCKGKTLVIDALGYGNELMAMNDPRPDECHKRGAPQKKANVEWAEVSYFGWPYMTVMATSGIRCGEEILIEYGEGFWRKKELVAGLWGTSAAEQCSGVCTCPFHKVA